jgi:hypothetical protein
MLFEQAVRNKYRFNYRGVLTVEDLWDLSVESLDQIFKSLTKMAKEASEESLLSTPSKEDKELNDKIEIVKYIVKTKLEEKAKAKEMYENKAKKQRLLEIIKRKEDAQLENMSIEELKRAMEEI